MLLQQYVQFHFPWGYPNPGLLITPLKTLDTFGQQLSFTQAIHDLHVLEVSNLQVLQSTPADLPRFT